LMSLRRKGLICASQKKAGRKKCRKHVATRRGKGLGQVPFAAGLLAVKGRMRRVREGGSPRTERRVLGKETPMGVQKKEKMTF